MARENKIAEEIKIRSLYPIVKRHGKVYVVIGFMGLIVGALEGINLAIFLPILQQIMGAGDSVMTDGQFEELFSFTEGFFNFDNRVLFLGSVFIFLSILKASISLIYEYSAARVSANLLYKYRKNLVDFYKEAPISYFDEKETGETIYNFITTPMKVSRLLYLIPQLFIEVMRVGFILIVLFIVEPSIALSLLFVGMLAIMSSLGLLKKHISRIAKNLYESEQNLTRIGTEWVKSVQQIRLAGQDDYWRIKLDNMNDKIRVNIRKNYFLLSAPRHVIEVTVILVMLAAIMIIYIKDPQAMKGYMAVIGVFALGVVRILPSISTLVRIPMSIRSIMPNVEYMENHIAHINEIRDAQEKRRKSGLENFNGINRNIELKNIELQKEGRGKLLDNIHMDLEKGKVFGIVGESGSGKTTLLKIIAGAIPPDSGTVKYDGVDIERVDVAAIKKYFGFVPQEPMLFSGSIKDNITFFNIDIDTPSVEKAAKTAEIHDYIDSLPEKYSTKVGESGVNLSGGQKQKIAIARTLIAKPEILLLDEVTSALDPKSEASVINAIRSAAKGRTTILVTHRLKTINWVDKIYVMKHGRIVEEGAWDELLNKTDGYFKKMYEQQYGSKI